MPNFDLQSEQKKVKNPFVPIIDLHCDLLGCIEYGKGKLHFNSPETNCSLSQLIQGNVKLQVLAVSAITQKGSSIVGHEQVKLYQDLLKTYSNQVGAYNTFSIDSPKTHFVFAIENASAMIEEDESFDLFFERFGSYRSIEEILYISLTWNQENRFGGGNATKVGLKRDGEVVLEYLDGKNVALDLSHTSDALAYDLLNFIRKKSLKIPVIASHSNYRAVQNIERNLPDEIAQEIISQKGLIGLNFVHRFVGESESAFIKHIEHGLGLGGENSICLGADFYGGMDIPLDLCPGKTPVTFFTNFSNSGCYSRLIALLKGSFQEELIHKICYQNVSKFIAETLIDGLNHRKI